MSVIDYIRARRLISLSLSLSLNLNKLTAKDSMLKNTKEVIFLLENRINPNFVKASYAKSVPVKEDCGYAILVDKGYLPDYQCF